MSDEHLTYVDMWRELHTRQKWQVVLAAIVILLIVLAKTVPDVLSWI